MNRIHGRCSVAPLPITGLAVAARCPGLWQWLFLLVWKYLVDVENDSSALNEAELSPKFWPVADRTSRHLARARSALSDGPPALVRPAIRGPDFQISRGKVKVIDVISTTHLAAYLAFEARYLGT